MHALTVAVPLLCALLISAAAGFVLGRASVRRPPMAPGPAPAPASGQTLLAVEDAPEPAVPTEVVDRMLRGKDEQLGRLESGAMSALERTVTRFETQVEDLRAELDEAGTLSRDLDARLGEESMRARHLEEALARRDATLAELRGELDTRR
ncbi:MAG: hypothetical protein U0R80_19460 [Nocardioidaceae bacterium]